MKSRGAADEGLPALPRLAVTPGLEDLAAFLGADMAPTGPIVAEEPLPVKRRGKRAAPKPTAKKRGRRT